MSRKFPTQDEATRVGLIHYELRPLYIRAVSEDLKFHSKIDPTLIIKPSQLALLQAHGQYLWGRSNWILKK